MTFLIETGQHSPEYANNIELVNGMLGKGIEAQKLIVLMEIARSLDLLVQASVKGDGQ